MADSTAIDDVNTAKTVIGDKVMHRSDASVATNLIVNSPIQILHESKEIFVYIEVCA
jgi:hypothetical protein